MLPLRQLPSVSPFHQAPSAPPQLPPPAFWMWSGVFRLTPKEGPMVKLYDKFVLPVTRAAERVMKPPFGQSVYAVARVPDALQDANPAMTRR